MIKLWSRISPHLAIETFTITADLQLMVETNFALIPREKYISRVLLATEKKASYQFPYVVYTEDLTSEDIENIHQQDIKRVTETLEQWNTYFRINQNATNN